MPRLSLSFWACLFIFYIPASLSVPLEQHDAQCSDGCRTAGYVGTTDEAYGVSTWLGVRYAEPPVGPLRLQPPQLARSCGIINATSFGPQCFQLSAPNNANQSEDCLYLNIYKPSDAALRGHGYGYDQKWDTDSLLVMLFIHGGAFNDGTGQTYDPRSLVKTSIELGTPAIIVTINYRLSFFGFSAGRTAIANNALNLGLLDQRMALQWVQNNIRAFGGDPTKVTLFGQSAGGASVGLQITAYNGAEENLFRAAIMESGTPQVRVPTPPATWPPYQKAWDSVIAGIGCNTSANVFSCVQNTSTQVLFPVIRSVGRLLSPLPSSTAPWEPVVDGTFVADFPTKLLAEGKFAKVPTIIGFTTDELTYIIPTSLNISSNALLAGIAQFVLQFVPLPIILQLLALDPLSTYPNPYNIGGTQWKRATEIASDLFERCPGRAFARNMTLFKPTWKYRWNAGLPSQIALIPEQGIVHGSDVPYVFGPSYTSNLNASLDLSLSLTVQKAWLSFAAHLDPNRLGDLGCGEWPRYENATEQVLVFQKPDGTGEFSNGSFGLPVGQGLHLENDPDNRPMCDFIIANDAAFLH